MKSLRKLYVAFAVLPLAACGPDLEPQEVQPEQVVGVAQPEVSTTGLTPHFRSWLSANGYDSFNFARTDLVGGSYGGRASSTDTVTRQPVIFIHGNSDKAVGTGTAGQTGWNASIQYFLSRGYKTSELYATTWGPANALASSQQYHSRENLTRLRRFVEAVRAYTGATRVDIIAHSMGVTLGRKVVLGGAANDMLAGGSYNLGPALTSSVDTFVGIAGGNLGLTSCFVTGPTTPTCGSTNGLYPGVLSFGVVTGRSDILNNLLATRGYEGAFRYTIHSTVDEIIGGGGLVYGQYTSRIPGQTGEKMYFSFPYGHFNAKDLTAEVQYEMVVNHRVP